jgi:hypothetical protein
MAESTLVDRLKQEGQELINYLVRWDIPIAAAWWVKPKGEPEFQLYLASPQVDTFGPKFVYEKIYKAFQGVLFTSFSLGQIKVIGLNDQMTKDFLKIFNRYGANPPTYIGECWLGNIEADEVHIYPTPTKEYQRGNWEQRILKTEVAVSIDEPSPAERQLMREIVASGTSNTAQAGHFVWTQFRDQNPPTIPAGTLVKAWVVAMKDDPNPVLLVETMDGKQRGYTRKNNTGPVGEHTIPPVP